MRKLKDLFGCVCFSVFFAIIGALVMMNVLLLADCLLRFGFVEWLLQLR